MPYDLMAHLPLPLLIMLLKNTRYWDGKSRVEIKKLSKENGTDNNLLRELGFPGLRGMKI